MKKTIQLVCSVPFYAHHDLGEINWLDVWVRYKDGRRKVYLGPCFECLGHIDMEIAHYESFIRKYETLGPEQSAREFMATSLEMAGDCWSLEETMSVQQSNQEYYVSEVKRLKDLRALFAATDTMYAFDPRDSAKDDCPNIYVRATTLTRGAIEGAVAWYLTQLGVKNPNLRFRWNKPRLYCWPAG